MISDRYWEYYWVKHIGQSVRADILSDDLRQILGILLVKHFGLSASADILSDDLRQILGMLLG